MTHTPIARELRIEPRPVGRPRGSPDLRGKARRAHAVNAERWALRLALACRDARIEQGVSASELAAALGVAEVTVFNWESGRVLLSTVRVYQIATALGMYVSELVEAA